MKKIVYGLAALAIRDAIDRKRGRYEGRHEGRQNAPPHVHASSSPRHDEKRYVTSKNGP